MHNDKYIVQQTWTDPLDSHSQSEPTMNSRCEDLLDLEDPGFVTGQIRSQQTKPILILSTQARKETHPLERCRSKRHIGSANLSSCTVLSVYLLFNSVMSISQSFC